MSDGTFSQDEIDALLAGVDSTNFGANPRTVPPSSHKDGALSADEIEALLSGAPESGISPRGFGRLRNYNDIDSENWSDVAEHASKWSTVAEDLRAVLKKAKPDISDQVDDLVTELNYCIQKQKTLLTTFERHIEGIHSKQTRLEAMMKKLEPVLSQIEKFDLPD